MMKNKQNFISIRDWLNEEEKPPTFNQIFRIKNKWVPIGKDAKKDLIQNFMDLVTHAYEPLGGHLKVDSTKDLSRDDWDVWWANDVDEDPDADVVFFGKRTPYGVKLVGVGHDGGFAARKEAMAHRGHILMKPGAYLETSSKPYMILYNKYNTNIVKDPKIIEAVLDKPIQWHGRHPKGKDGDPHGNDYWYSRKIGDKVVIKIMMGNPLIDGIK